MSSISIDDGVSFWNSNSFMILLFNCEMVELESISSFILGETATALELFSEYGLILK